MVRFEEMRASRFGKTTENKTSLGKAKAGWSVSSQVLPTDCSVESGLEDSHKNRRTSYKSGGRKNWGA